MKALFLIFHGFAAHNGISKKIFYQVNAMRQCGVETQLCYTQIEKNGDQLRMIDDTILENYGNNTASKIKKRACYGKLTKYIIDNGIDFLYIRSAHNANPFITKMVRRLHKHGVRIVMEIPTYPYEGQFKASSRKDKLRLKLDIMCRDTMAKYLDYIVTFADVPKILGVPTIIISNGIDFDETPVKTRINDTTEAINLVGVAELHYWHGFDRMIEGLAKYYSTPQQQKVVFNIVGHGVESEVHKLKSLSEQLGMGEYVKFHGALAGDDLTEAFESADMGIASLARHRSNITYVKTLKNREYAARGIAFIYSEIDEDFEQMPYIMKVPADETPINIEEVVAFFKANSMTPEQIRESIISTLSWKVQMQKVIDSIIALNKK